MCALFNLAMNQSRDPAFFGRRKGKPLRAHQSGLIDELLPKLRVNLQDLAAPDAKERWLEIGFGGGEHLAHDAAAHPDVEFIGCEPFVNGVAKLLSQIDAAGLTNIRIYDGDATDVLDALPDSSIGRVNILYPDPWPKSRHRKRRFISDASVASLARVMRAGAELRFATDIDDYAGWTLAHLQRAPGFRWTAETAKDWETPWAGWPGTRYEAKALREGRNPAYLTFVRRSAGD